MICALRGKLTPQPPREITRLRTGSKNGSWQAREMPPLLGEGLGGPRKGDRGLGDQAAVRSWRVASAELSLLGQSQLHRPKILP